MNLVTLDIISTALKYDPTVGRDQRNLILTACKFPGKLNADRPPRLLKTAEAASRLGESKKVFLSRADDRHLTKRSEGNEFKWLESEISTLVIEGSIDRG